MSDVQTKSNKNLIIGACVASAIIAGYLSFGSSSDVTIIESNESSLSPDAFKPLTIADVWQGDVKKLPSAEELKQNITQTEKEPIADDASEPEIKLDYDYIHQEIGKIRVNEDGSIILDDITLNALRKAFPSSRLNFSSEMLEELEEILKKGLPGIAGEQAAEIIRNFYEFQVANRDLRDVYRDININNNHEETLAEMKALREVYLGKEVADKLFEKEDKNSNYMLKAFEISANKDLTPEQKIEKRNELNHSYIEPIVENWRSRYQEYQNELETIKNSEKTEQQKATEIKNLKNSHFKKEELEVIVNGNISMD